MHRDDFQLKNQNVLFVTLDSCRYDTAAEAWIPNIKRVGHLRKAYTHGDYTVSAHTAFFAGHLPVVLDEEKRSYYSESVNQLWRIRTGLSRDNKRCGLLLEGNNVLEGYRKKGFYVLGVGGVTQFNHGSILRTYFGDDFIYCGPNLDEEPLAPRQKNNFPLNHIDEIVERIAERDKWFLFINCPETHYPYDIGDGISKDIIDYYKILKHYLNLQEPEKDIIPSECLVPHQLPIDYDIYSKLHSMQRKALESIDRGLGVLLDKLPGDIRIVICGDHGENFGEEFAGKKRWGHMIPSPKVMEVPLVIGMKNGSS